MLWPGACSAGAERASQGLSPQDVCVGNVFTDETQDLENYVEGVLVNLEHLQHSGQGQVWMSQEHHL